ncbi:MAG: transketolase [Myxococcales bacterium]|nr:transketolase [Myxococcales bacterium]
MEDVLKPTDARRLEDELLQRLSIEQLAVTTIRTLGIDAVEAASSGHPGTVMGLAPVAYTLWQRFLRYDPDHPVWTNRDRFVLSIGHASMLLYAVLHLAQVKAKNPKYEAPGRLSVRLDDIRSFRQLSSRCAGHPEHMWTSGVECTTGPLGQGVATSVGMAIAERWMAKNFNRPSFELIDFDVYALCGDGCLMEGVAQEAASLAGHLGLSHLCWIYDNNRITIDGPTDLSFSENVVGRFAALGWHVQSVDDANDIEQLTRAFRAFKAEATRPTLIIVDSHIGWGSPNKQDSAAAHGSPLGEEEARLTKRNYGWPEEAKFFVPSSVVEHFADGMGERGRALYQQWHERVERYRLAFPDLYDRLYKMQHRELPDDWDKDLPTFEASQEGIALRKASGKVLNALSRNVPWIVGGSADLASSTQTRLDAYTDFQSDGSGNNIHFGVREHAMGSIINGMSLCKLRSYGSTYLVFSDYARPSIRLSAMMELPVVYVLTHDSISVGEDGPTHQPVEHLASLRALPHLLTIRPGDANEVVEMWKVIMQLRHRPVALILTRQNVPTIDRSKYAPATGAQRGAYILADADGGEPQVLLLATGSEVPLCIAAYEQLEADGIRARVVSMPCWELFEDQDQGYIDHVLPPKLHARVSVELSSTFGWAKYVGKTGATMGVELFGASAPVEELHKKFGFTLDNVVAAAKAQLVAHGD